MAIGSSKAYSYISSLTKRERSAFRKYLMGERRKFQLQLFEMVSEGNAELDWEEVWVKFFPEKKYHKHSLSRYLSDLIHQIEDFWATQEFHKNSILKEILLLKRLERVGGTGFQHSLHKVNRRLQNHNSELEIPLQYLALFAELKTNVENPDIRKNEFDQKWGNTNEALDQYYYASKLNLLLFSYKKSNYAWLEPEDQEHIEAKRLVDEIAGKRFLNSKKLEHLSSLVQLINKNGETYEKKVVEGLAGFVSSSSMKLADLEKHNITVSLFYYAFKHSNLYENEAAFADGLNLSRFLLQSEFFADSTAFINPEDITNVIRFELKMGEIDKAVHIVNLYRDSIAPEYREYHLLFWEALIQFERKCFRMAQFFLESLTSQEPNPRYNSAKTLQRVLSLKILHEMETQQGQHLELILTRLNTFKVWLHRQSRMMAEFKTPYTNFVNTFLVMTNYYPGDHKLKKLLQKLDERPTAEKDWLRTKIQDLLSQKTEDNPAS